LILFDGVVVFFRVVPLPVATRAFLFFITGVRCCSLRAFGAAVPHIGVLYCYTFAVWCLFVVIVTVCSLVLFAVIAVEVADVMPFY